MSLRSTGIARKSELRRRTPMPRGKVALARRAGRTIAAQRPATGPTATQRRVVADRAGFCCESCGLALHDGQAWIRAHSFHHRQPRGAGGTRRDGVNSPANLLLLCGTGTTGCHGQVESRRTAAYQAGLLVRQPTDPAVVAVKIWCFPDRVLLTDDGQYREAA